MIARLTSTFSLVHRITLQANQISTWMPRSQNLFPLSPPAHLPCESPKTVLTLIDSTLPQSVQCPSASLPPHRFALESQMQNLSVVRRVQPHRRSNQDTWKARREGRVGQLVYPRSSIPHQLSNVRIISWNLIRSLIVRSKGFDLGW